MANFCNNTLRFSGDCKAIEKVTQCFLAMRNNEEVGGKGQMPDFLKFDEGFFHNIDVWEPESICYDTKWSPNIQVVLAIANYFGLDFELFYEELGNPLYGKAIYKNKEYNEFYLTPEDFSSYEKMGKVGGQNFDDWYIFEGKEYTSEIDILDILLDRKIEQHGK